MSGKHWTDVEMERIAAHDKTLPALYAGRECTLDGRPAIVCGRLEPYGTVATLPDGPRYQWGWATISRVIMDRDGAFTS